MGIHGENDGLATKTANSFVASVLVIFGILFLMAVIGSFFK